MHSIVQRILSETPKNQSFQWLGDFVRSIDIDALTWAGDVPALDSEGNYTRNILCMEPFECVLIHWPPGAQSAIHHHRGFWGYVLCLEGEVENVEYGYSPGGARNGKDGRAVLTELQSCRAGRGGILNEPDGAIHKIVNASSSKPLLTLHFYSPALVNLDTMVIFDEQKLLLGELNEKAQTASFNQASSCFRRLERDAFDFVPLQARFGFKTHRFYPLFPKPQAAEIRELVATYYCEQAEVYDAKDAESALRVQYTEGVNRLIAGRIAEVRPDKVLDIACGTGRRAVAVRELTGLSYSIDGIDISVSMVEQARDRGVEARIGSWGDCSVDRGDYDAITLMYAFGHFSSRVERKQALSQAFACLKAGGLFIFDAFNVEDPDEWGPAASQMYDTLDLGEHGYERGDVFYRKHAGDGVAFLHYCEASELNALLTEVGFILESVQHIGYGKNTGEVVEDGGKLLLFARRPD